MIWKCEAEGDTVYVEADDEGAAYDALTSKLGPIPRRMLKLKQVDTVPKGEELL